MIRPFLALALVLGSNFALAVYSPRVAQADSRRVKCPVVVDRETGEYSTSKAKYLCFERKSKAVQSGYSHHSFSDDSSGSCSPSATPQPGQSTGLNLSGPGERKSTVFTMPSGGSLTYLFPGGGEFEIKVMNAATDQKIVQILETFQASSGTLTLSPQSVPVFIKVEGPGVWTVAIDLN